MAYLIIGFIAICLTVAQTVDIQLGSSTVEDNDLLEKGLEKYLKPFGVKEVDVEDHDDQGGVFEVSIKTDTLLDQENRANLLSALKSLGFTDARIETVSLEDKEHNGEAESRFLVYLNLPTMKDTMKSFATDVL